MEKIEKDISVQSKEAGDPSRSPLEHRKTHVEMLLVDRTEWGTFADSAATPTVPIWIF